MLFLNYRLYTKHKLNFIPKSLYECMANLRFFCIGYKIVF